MRKTLKCSQCGVADVSVGDYMEGDEHEVVCDACEEMWEDKISEGEE